MTPSRFQHLVAVPLMLVAAAMWLLPPTWAGGSASFSGRVLQGDGISPRAGVVVALFDAGRDHTYRSGPTNDEGAFRIENAPPGSYSLLVELEQGAFLSPQPLSLQAGSNAPLALTLLASPNYQTETGLGKSSNLSPVVKWVIVGVIAAAAVFVISEVSKDENETSASAF